MSEEIYFFIIFLATILITRLLLYFKPIPSPTVKGFRLHHYMYGLLLMIIGALLKSTTIYAVGLALFLDEFPYLIHESGTHGDKEFNKKTYWRKKILAGITCFNNFSFLAKKIPGVLLRIILT